MQLSQRGMEPGPDTCHPLSPQRLLQAQFCTGITLELITLAHSQQTQISEEASVSIFVSVLNPPHTFLVIVVMWNFSQTQILAK